MISLKNWAIASVAILALAACESAPEDSGTVDGSGMASGQNGGMNDGSILPGSQADLETNVGDRVFFSTDSSVIQGEAQGTLERQATWLKQYGDVNVVIEGHADERGTREYNLALGERRATAAKNYLTSLGVPAARVSTISYGKERPAVMGNDESSWGQNRRAVTVISE